MLIGLSVILCLAALWGGCRLLDRCSVSALDLSEPPGTNTNP